MNSKRQFRVLQWGFLVLGLALLGSWSRNDLVSRQFQATESRKLDAGLRGTQSGKRVLPEAGPLRAVTSMLPRTKRAGPEVVGRIEIPRLRIRAIVAEGCDTYTLGRAVGHVTSTALPGDEGNCALAGHRDTFFRGLGGVHANDIIRIVSPKHTYNYRVEWTKVVEPTRVDVLDATANPSLTLVTCYPFVFIGHAPKRFVVRARQLPPGYPVVDPAHGQTAERR